MVGCLVCNILLYSLSIWLSLNGNWREKFSNSDNNDNRRKKKWNVFNVQSHYLSTIIRTSKEYIIFECRCHRIRIWKFWIFDADFRWYFCINSFLFVSNECHLDMLNTIINVPLSKLFKSTNGIISRSPIFLPFALSLFDGIFWLHLIESMRWILVRRDASNWHKFWRLCGLFVIQ